MSARSKADRDRRATWPVKVMKKSAQEDGGLALHLTVEERMQAMWRIICDGYAWMGFDAPPRLQRHVVRVIKRKR